MTRMPFPFCEAYSLKTCLYYASAVTELELLAYSDLSPQEESLIEELDFRKISSLALFKI